jgi:hypothetical protein
MISSLLEKADEDFLVEPIVHGVPKSTKLVLGKEQFTLQELKSLPRLSDSKMTAHDVYIDPVRIGDTVTNWKLYVGSATGEYGSGAQHRQDSSCTSNQEG